MGEARPSLPSHSCIALLTGGLLLLTAFIFAAPAKHSTWPDLLNQFTPAQRLVVPWEPLLTREELLRGLSYYGTGARLQAVAAKLLAGQPIKVYTLGGSITRGGGARSEELKYVARFFNAINASFPHRDHVFANKGSSAATSFFFAPCMSYHAPEGADLVVVEFTMNDPYDGPLTTAVRRSYESGERDLTLFAHYYDFPSVSVRSGTFHLQNMGIEHFKVDKIAAAGWTTNEQRHYFAEPNGTVVEGKLAAAPADQNDQYFYSDE
ncbi:hypothetical protein C2E21_0414 [Chlorella sorokiniana]|uniref:SGNH hydrolase-type esterase domain-containing protein n=1 Tax=Chlorella sorokiniana TaxID=3076 RepID=A0A2P6U3U9_CHLSO|nr:hypothetical protein C2E21_0414 [Chlorella sorokiniana]|eukprot:PRW60976.1 hypothetical protein C2E21_0414 [Chlorella sorokiniana]